METKEADGTNLKAIQELRKGAHVTDQAHFKWTWAGRTGTNKYPMLGINNKVVANGITKAWRVRKPHIIEKFVEGFSNRNLSIKKRGIFIREGADFITTLALAKEWQECDQQTVLAGTDRRRARFKRVERERKRVVKKGGERVKEKFLSKFNIQRTDSLENISRKLGVMVTVLSADGYMLEEAESYLNLATGSGQLTLIKTKEDSSLFNYIPTNRLSSLGKLFESKKKSIRDQSDLVKDSAVGLSD